MLGDVPRQTDRSRTIKMAKLDSEWGELVIGARAASLASIDRDRYPCTRIIQIEWGHSEFSNTKEGKE